MGPVAEVTRRQPADRGISIGNPGDQAAFRGRVRNVRILAEDLFFSTAPARGSITDIGFPFLYPPTLLRELP